MNLSELKSKLTKSLEFLKTELTQIRTGRASPSLIEDVQVMAYGSKMTLKELGSIVLLDSQNIIVTPWDKNLVKDIATGIRESGKGLNPVEDSDKVRVPIPSLTEDRRREYTKTVAVKVEDAKNAMRHTRQEAMKDIDKDFSSKVIGEDEKFSQKESVEDLVKEFVDQAEELGEKKKTDLMTV
jgi:ribosome recycling factor